MERDLSQSGTVGGGMGFLFPLRGWEESGLLGREDVGRSRLQVAHHRAVRQRNDRRRVHRIRDPLSPGTGD